MCIIASFLFFSFSSSSSFSFIFLVVLYKPFHLVMEGLKFLRWFTNPIYLVLMGQFGRENEKLGDIELEE